MGESIQRLYEIVTRLRGPGGCPWDREQTHASLRASLIEESHEAVEGIDARDDAILGEELGDLLLVVIMHARIAEERGAFTLEDVAASACEKMIRRHPHVFGEATAADSAAVLRQWEAIKRSEKGGQVSLLGGVSRSLPALLRAQTVQKKASRVGFDWPDAEGPRQKVEEEWREVEQAVAQGEAGAVEEELGDFFFAAVNYTRKLGCDAETVLSASTGKFLRRFQQMEQHLASQGMSLEGMSLAELDAAWDACKAKETTAADSPTLAVVRSGTEGEGD